MTAPAFVCLTAPQLSIRHRTSTLCDSRHRVKYHRRELPRAAVSPPPVDINVNKSLTASQPLTSVRSVESRQASNAAHYLQEPLPSLHLATRGDLGPLRNVDIESTGLFVSVAGGAVVASLVILFLVLA